ncbi:glycosyltransferase family 4 protein [Polluticoccus soli]|uniref:glycosyltransferase family 4 protein n=1 Tax=Polluticoccus soli TaxID=3034150 RepID=UPI0023E2B45F|nr:glycosyltransferase family 4 protein [Flavipsychrobacter sp. JY13-12]
MLGKVRILFTIPNFLTAGSGREMFNIVERLDKNIFEPIIAVNQVGGALYDEILNRGYPIISEKFCVDEHKPKFNKVISAVLLAKKFKRYNFQIWQSFNWSSDYTEALVARFSGARYIYVKKNMNWDRQAWKIKSILSTAIVARNTDLTNGPLNKRRFRHKTFFVPGGISADFWSSPSYDWRLRFNIPADATLVSCIAQLVKVKDQATLIRAVNEIDNVYLILAGAERDVAYTNSLRQLIAEKQLEERVFFAGSVGNVSELLQASDIFVLPTTNADGHEEGCPVALLEAMAAGVPCIVSDVAGSRDLARPRQTGLLFAPGQVAELAECIKYYMENPDVASAIASNGKEMVKAHYTLEKEAEGFSNMYKKIMKL